MSQKFKSNEGRKMITMDKKYRCRDGVPATVLAVGLNSVFPVVFIRRLPELDSISSVMEDGRVGINSEAFLDLIEISPYDDFKIDDPVMVSRDRRVWFRNHFAGVDKAGNPTVFDGGSTSWSKTDYDPTSWKYCRRPTPEELGE